MQISRHWRMNAQRYRLEGIRYEDGNTSLQQRPLVTVGSHDDETAVVETVDAEGERVAVHAA